jgi:hypothetical protein
MADYDVFNGDADGICALLQLRLAEPRDAELITGVKRDIGLLERVKLSADPSSDRVTVLDISMDKNKAALESTLASGASVLYFDHHFPGDIPDHPNLTAGIDTQAEICTGLLVNQYLEQAYPAWAVTAAYGDNLHNAARAAASDLNLSDDELGKLETLGTLLNYNGYGATVDDLFFAPDDLFRKLLPYANPLDFINEDDTFTALDNGYQGDMDNARAVSAQLATDHCAMFVFPEEKWSRRVGGVYGNLLARENPDRAHALLSAISEDTFQVSVRAPVNRREGADELCRQFATGGGRKAAAGINVLPAADVDKFSDAFEAQFAPQ